MTEEEAVPGNDQSAAAEAGAQEPDPVRRWTIVLLVVMLLLVACYLVADRWTPFTSQARVHALVVPVAAEVSGTVTEVLVGRNRSVSAGDVLFRIDPTQYELAVASAEANLEAARQATGASTATVAAAEAGVLQAQAALDQARTDAVRLRRIREQDPGAISERRVETAESSLEVAEQQLAAARANLEQARQTLGQEGEQNSRILQARAALEQARVDLARTTVAAPTDGVVTDVRVDRGNFAGAGVAQMTFISTRSLWVQADFTENNLGNVDLDDPVEVVFDVYPGRVFEGRIREVGFGVAVDSAPLGSLPTIQNDRDWLRSAQRFPVVVAFEMDDAEVQRLRVGAQVSVMVYAGDNPVLNLLGNVYLRLAALLSYAY